AFGACGGPRCRVLISASPRAANLSRRCFVNTQPIARCPDGECRRISAGGGGSTADELEISASVGANAANRPDDVRVIQDALNQVPARDGCPEPPLKVYGLCFGKTLSAIRKFQKDACAFKWPDGRVDAKCRTHDRLRDFLIP